MLLVLLVCSQLYDVNIIQNDNFLILKFRMIASFQVANIIYLDQPVGTGFSYSRNRFADRPSDTRAAKRVNEFLRRVKGTFKWSVKASYCCCAVAR